MKYITSFILACSFSLIGYSQADMASQAKADIEPLKTAFDSKKQDFEKEQKELKRLTDMLDGGASAQMGKAQKLKVELDSIYSRLLAYKNYYLLKGVPKDSLDAFFTTPENFAVLGETAKGEDKKSVYVLYGNNKIAKQEFLEKNDEVKALFEDLLSIKSETCLGVFEIPGNLQQISLYKYDMNDKKFHMIPDKLVRFKEVKFSIREGRIYEIRVKGVGQDLREYYFENKVPVSLLNYNGPRGARTQHLYSSLEECYIKLSDILSYFPNPGNNYVPDDIEFVFPKEGTDTDDPNRRAYKVNQDSNLQNVMELRTYTDFLGLFGDAPNGIVQVEGKADFFVTPFQVGRRFPSTFFKKVSPYVNYSRLDDDTKGLSITPTVADDLQSIKRPLEILEKSYLDMGTLLDVYSFSPKKEYPFSFNFFTSLRYQVAAIDREDEDDVDFKTLGMGGGVRFEFRRLNNFGFLFSPEFTYYNHINRLDFMNNPRNFWALRYEAEIFYYPGASKAQSIFLRLRTFMDRGDGEDTFYQLQFGYRFSIGLGSAKAKD